MADKKRPTPKPAPDYGDVLAGAIAEASAAIVAAVGTALGASGGAGAVAGLSSQLVAADTQNKTDVNVPELMTGLNGLTQADQQSLRASGVGLQVVCNAALGFATLQAQSALAYNTGMMQDHRDQNHDKQINIDEQVAAAAALYGRLFATLNNPIPPLKGT